MKRPALGLMLAHLIENASKIGEVGDAATRMTLSLKEGMADLDIARPSVRVGRGGRTIFTLHKKIGDTLWRQSRPSYRKLTRAGSTHDFRSMRR